MAKMAYFIRRFDGKRESTYLGEDSTWGPLSRAYEWETYDGAYIEVEGWTAERHQRLRLGFRCPNVRQPQRCPGRSFCVTNTNDAHIVVSFGGPLGPPFVCAWDSIEHQLQRHYRDAGHNRHQTKTRGSFVFFAWSR